MTIDILFFAAIAVFLGWRLYSVLGQRIGHDKPVQRMQDQPVAANPDKQPRQTAQRHRAIRVAEQAQSGLDNLAALEPQFNSAEFMEGARIAREMIVEAFAKEDLATLKDLLTPALYETFESAVKHRQQQKQRLEYQFIGINEAEINHAWIEDGTAFIEVKFTTEHSQALYDESGQIIEGDMKYVERVTDIWTFTRKIGSPNPNWQLAATHEEEH